MATSKINMGLPFPNYGIAPTTSSHTATKSTQNTPIFTAPEDGWAVLGIMPTTNNGGSAIVTINGNWVLAQFASVINGRNQAMFPIRKGDIVRAHCDVNGSVATASVWFFEMQ